MIVLTFHREIRFDMMESRANERGIDDDSII